MRATPVRALVWEKWRVTSALLFGIVLVLAAIVVIAYSVDLYIFTAQEGEPQRDAALLGVSAMLFAWIIISGHQQEGTASSFSPIPARFHTYPMSTWKLTLVSMLYLAVVNAAVATVAAAALWSLWTFKFAWWVVPLVTVLATALFQAWALLIKNHYRVGVPASIVALALLVGWLVSSESAAALVRSLHPPVWCIIILPASFAGAVAGLRIQRHGGWKSNPSTLVLRYDNLEIATRRGHRFSSAEEAQAWFEWRRFGWHAPAFQIVALSFYLTIIPGLIFLLTGVGNYFGEFFKAWVLVLGLLVLLTLFALTPAAGAGIVMAGFDMNASRQKSDEFVFVRPRGTDFLVRARLSAVLKNLIVTFVILGAILVAYAIALQQFGEHETFAEALGSTGIPLPAWMVLVLIYVATAAFMWSLTSGATMMFMIFASFACLSIPAVVVGLNESGIAPGMARYEAPAMLAALVALAIVTAAAFSWLVLKARRLGFVSNRIGKVSFILWAVPALALGALVLPEVYDKNSFAIAGVAAAGIASAALLAAAPFYTWPLFFNYLRHR